MVGAASSSSVVVLVCLAHGALSAVFALSLSLQQTADTVILFDSDWNPQVSGDNNIFRRVASMDMRCLHVPSRISVAHRASLLTPCQCVRCFVHAWLASV